MKLKVCGMKYQDNIADVAALQPNYMGFIFYEKSSRFVQNNIPEIPDRIKKTGVFVNASLTYITEQIKRHNLQAIQLHGNESPGFCQELKHHEIEIIKVFSVKNTFDFRVLEPYESVCDYYLFDTKGKLPGGNGYTFNWDLLKSYPSTKPYFLSGGIGLGELEKIKEFKNSEVSKYCYAIDVNSKFEIEAGLKSMEKLKEFKSQI